MKLFFHRFLYVFLVLVLDSIVYLHPEFLGVHWKALYGRFSQWENSSFYFLRVFSAFDFFKFLFWFCIPLLFAYTHQRAQKNNFGTIPRVPHFSFILSKKELKIYFGFLFLGMSAILLLPYFPELRNYYPSQNHLLFSEKIFLFQNYILWSLSWLLGWEFLFRYYLLSAFSVQTFNLNSKKWALVLIPFLESFYHVLQRKDPLESLVMLFFSVWATLWCIKRKNILLPFLIHLSIELCLILFILFF